MSKSYVHDGKEVIATGRTAIRTLKGGREIVLYEVKPADMEDNDPQFCKWVKLEDLYHIQEDQINIEGDEEPDV